MPYGGRASDTSGGVRHSRLAVSNFQKCLFDGCRSVTTRVRPPFAALLATLVFATTATSTARPLHIPHYSRPIVTIAYLYDEASAHLHYEMLRPGGLSTSAMGRNPFVTAWSLRNANGVRSNAEKPRKLNYRLLLRVPNPKRYGVPRRPSGLRHHDIGVQPVEIQMISMSRFSSSDCILYPYIFTLDYDALTGAPLQESASMATPAQATGAGLPESEQIC